MNCSLGIIIRGDDHPALEWHGDRRVMVCNCNRADEHPRVGEHWYEHRGVRITFQLTEEQDKGVWFG
jgi:hypothetical protein